LGTFWGPKFTGIVDGKETLAYGGKDCYDFAKLFC
jgi:hypothetical protein